MTSRKAGNSTARFLAGPLVLTPDPGQQKQRAASASESPFSEKGQIGTPQFKIFNLKFLLQHCQLRHLAGHILEMFAASSSKGVFGAREVR